MKTTDSNKMIGETPIKKKAGKKTLKKTETKKSGEKKDMKYEVKPKEEKPEEPKKVDEGKKEEAVKVIQDVVVQNPTGISELTLDRGKIELLKATIAQGATDDELKMFINVCTGMGLSPFLKQVHMVKRWNSKLGRNVASIQVGIDGFRSIAENTGAYAGNDDPVMGEDIDAEGGFKAPSKATVTVYKIVQGVKCDFVATARWTEFYPGAKMGFMWKKMPNVMLGKCAEAQALRKAFPKVLGGVYAPEEMDQAGPSGKGKPKRTTLQIAKSMIAKETKVDTLNDFEGKIKKSDKYTDKEKTELSGLIMKRASEVESKENHDD